MAAANQEAELTTKEIADQAQASVEDRSPTSLPLEGEPEPLASASRTEARVEIDGRKIKPGEPRW